MDILLMAGIELAIAAAFLWVLSFLKKRDVDRNVGWFIIGLMVLVLNRVGRYLGYDEVTSGLADTLFLLILVPGYFLINKKFESKGKNGAINSESDDESKPN